MRRVVCDDLIRRRSAEQAVTAPRFLTNHHLGSFRQKAPQLASLQLDPAFGNSAIQDLRNRGHKVTLGAGGGSNPVMLRIDSQTGELQAAGDAKSRRHAGAY